MICGIGTDIVDIRRVELLCATRQDQFAARILSERERSRGIVYTPRDLAKAFAAKEAISKALGTGMRGGVSFKDMVILRDALGAPSVELTGVAAQRLHSLGGQRVWLSLADESHYAVAYAIASL
jgi:holo-[acyl-carrier protein] synthase